MAKTATERLQMFNTLAKFTDASYGAGAGGGGGSSGPPRPKYFQERLDCVCVSFHSLKFDNSRQ